MSWRKVLAWLKHLPVDSALAREVSPEDAEWNLAEHLLAAIYDVLTVANYQRTDGKGPKPKPLQRPGVGPKRSGTPHTRKEVWQRLRGVDPPEGVTDG